MYFADNGFPITLPVKNFVVVGRLINQEVEWWYRDDTTNWQLFYNIWGAVDNSWVLAL